MFDLKYACETLEALHTTDDEGNEVIIKKVTHSISGNNALALWRLGVNEWNKYVSQLNEVSISFEDVDFSNEPLNKNSEINFDGYQFPYGVSFEKANFGDTKVVFRDAQFGTGSVNFDRAVFGKRPVVFIKTNFGKCSVSFGRVDFSCTKVFFLSTALEEGDFSMANCTFNEPMLFSRCSFGKGDVCFSDSQFAGESVTFEEMDFGAGKVEFARVSANCHFNFSKLKFPERITALNFRGAVFEKTFDISNNHFRCVPDLTNTKLSFQVALDNLTCSPRFYIPWFLGGRARDKQDGHRLRRLKEISVQNKNQKAALEFHAQELRSSRWFSLGAVINDFVDLLYDLVSNYGRSELRPSLALLGLCLVLSNMYSELSLQAGFSGNSEDSLILAVCLAFPFLPISRSAQVDIQQTLFGSDPSALVILTQLSQSLISTVLIFLVGLALRNRFRI